MPKDEDKTSAIENQLKAVLIEVSELERLLKPFEELINKISSKRLAEMSVSEKINVAKLIVQAKNQH